MICNHALYRVFFLGPTRTISQILMTVGQKNPHVTMELDDINCQCFDGKPIVFFAKSNHLEPTMSIQTPLRWRWHRNVAPPPHHYLCVAALAAVSVGSVVLVKHMQWMQNWNLMPIVSMPPACRGVVVKLTAPGFCGVEQEVRLERGIKVIQHS